MTARRFLALLPLFTLAGCSYVYDVRAEMQDGVLVFTSDKDWFRERCVRQIAVVAEDREYKADAEPGDDQTQVGYGTYWHEMVGNHCENRFPITYGADLDGPELPEGERYGSVAAKELKVGINYRVETVSGSTGYGHGRFMIRRDGMVENLD